MTDKNCQNTTKVLFLAATVMEQEAVYRAFGTDTLVVVTGIGGIATMASTLRAIEEHTPDTVIQIGIAGAVSRELSVGEVVIVSSDYTADLGAWREEEEKFVPFTSDKYFSDFSFEGYRRVSARSVNTATSGIVTSCEDIESMEGAYFFAAAALKGICAIQIRAISNRVDDKRCEWQIKGALKSLTGALKEMFSHHNITRLAVAEKRQQDSHI